MGEDEEVGGVYAFKTEQQRSATGTSNRSKLTNDPQRTIAISQISGNQHKEAPS